MRRILGIAEFTIRKIEEPAFIILLIFGLIAGYFSSEMEAISSGTEYLQIAAFEAEGENVLPLLGGFVLLILFTLLIAGFYGATDIPREIESGIVMILLGKPVSRTEYLLGKYLGIICIALLFYFLSSIALCVGHYVKTGALFPFDLFLRQLFLMLIIFPFTAINLAISCFLHDLSAMILAAIYVLISFASGLIPIALSLLPPRAGIDLWLNLIYYPFPNFYYFLLPAKMGGLVFFSLLIYAASLSVIFLFLGSLKIESRDML